MKKTKTITLILSLVLIVGVLVGCLSGCAKAITAEDVSKAFETINKAIENTINVTNPLGEDPSDFYVKVNFAQTGGVTRNSSLQVMMDDPETEKNELVAKFVTDYQNGTFAERISTYDLFGYSCSSKFNKDNPAKPSDYIPYAFSSATNRKVLLTDSKGKEYWDTAYTAFQTDFNGFLDQEKRVPYNVLTNQLDTNMQIKELYPETIVSKISDLNADMIDVNEKVKSGIFKTESLVNTWEKQGVTDIITLKLKDDAKGANGETHFYAGKTIIITIVDEKISRIEYEAVQNKGEDNEKTTNVIVDIIYGSPKTGIISYDLPNVNDLTPKA